MDWLQVVNMVFGWLWLTAMLALLWLIWRGNTRRMRQIEVTIIDIAQKNAESARKAVETTTEVVEMLKEERKK